MGGKNLDGYVTPQMRISCTVNFAHAACAARAINDVPKPTYKIDNIHVTGFAGMAVSIRESWHKADFSPGMISPSA